MTEILIKNAEEHNLKSISLTVPHNKLIAVTGVSGSGKSSLAFDIICKEGQRRYLETFSGYARLHLQQLTRPNIEHISGLQAAIAIDQKTVNKNPRSTVGTMTEIYDHLRLLFARLGSSNDTNTTLTQSLFSFNSDKGACTTCKGLGVEDKIDPELFVEDENKTLREGCLKISTSNGYIMYSQVTIDVLNQVCESEGFNVDIPWKDLSPFQKNIILNGSEKITIPYGKHTLESRLTWSGITAKPREEGFYKGILPVMETILKRDRNPSILRFTRSIPCTSCLGKRLNKASLTITFDKKNIAWFTSQSIDSIHKYFTESTEHSDVFLAIKEEIIKRTSLLIELGLGYLNIERESTSLTGGEAQRIRLTNQVITNLQGALYVFDEPSIGLHPKNNKALIKVLRQLTDNGNTVLVVEHDEETIRNADWIIDIGPKAGVNGGELIFNGSLKDFINADLPNSLTQQYLLGKKEITIPKRRVGKETFEVVNASKNNLKDINATFYTQALNVITGVSGAGKSSLIDCLIDDTLSEKKNGYNHIKRIIHIDQSPIGRTPRSNPATYTKLFDDIRYLYAKLPESKERKWKKGRFSFNNKGGRCETCQGAGYTQTGMHFLGDVEVLCSECNGKRFNNETLEVQYKNKNIYEVLELSINDATIFFSEDKKIAHVLNLLKELGLGYLTLGQPATTISGGEAQRVKLASELKKSQISNTLYILDEPTTGLHFEDINLLLHSIQQLIEKGNTIIAIEHNTDVIKCADHIIDLGPDSGDKGGEIVASGKPEEIIKNTKSHTALALQQALNKTDFTPILSEQKTKTTAITFKNVCTNNLKNIDVTIPYGQLTVITGVSGSGKSSLAFDTLFSEGQNRFTESISSYARRFIKNVGKGNYEKCNGITPSIAISQNKIQGSPRSTIGTITEIYDYYRLLFSRAGNSATPLLSNMFSFNHQEGACENCKGLGTLKTCDADKLISIPELSLSEGAMKGSKAGIFYGDPYGQYIATLHTVGEKQNIDFTLPYAQLSDEAKEIAMHGTGDTHYGVKWKFKRKNREGIHEMKTPWLGFLALINEEYERKHADKRAEVLEPIMKNVSCSLCNGSGLKEKYLKVEFAGHTIAYLSSLEINESIPLFEDILENAKSYNLSAIQIAVSKEILPEIIRRLKHLNELGLGYLSIQRKSNTLSGGEAQRVRLASLLGAELSGITYVLDEPTTGLHANDITLLIQKIKELKDKGNHVIVVEHDLNFIKHADHIIDMGPQAGKLGGEIIASGDLNTIKKQANSITGHYLNNQIKFQKSIIKLQEGISIKDASANNLKYIDIHIPKGGTTVITGVSGSGKTSLVFEVLAKSYKMKKAINCTAISGLGSFNQIIKVNQKAIGNTPASTPATYTGIFDEIRNVFAKTENAKSLHLKKNDFSFNAKTGRCASCNGMGKTKVSMDFLADIWSTCEVCKGSRYQTRILETSYKEKNISEVLKMSVLEAAELFSNEKKIADSLNILVETGLGYLQLGQASNTLSGGESQRLKLATEIIKNTNNNTLFLFDEPSTGLHLQDIELLLVLFNKLVEQGNSIVIIEHQEDIIRFADSVIELGPVGGKNGGYLV